MTELKIPIIVEAIIALRDRMPDRGDRATMANAANALSDLNPAMIATQAARIAELEVAIAHVITHGSLYRTDADRLAAALKGPAR